MKHWRLLLILVAVACFGVALSYPIRYRMAEQSNNTELESLSAMRNRVLSEIGEGGPYHCMLGQSATVTGTDYTEKVDLVIQAYQVQIGEAGMYIHVERAREYNG